MALNVANLDGSEAKQVPVKIIHEKSLKSIISISSLFINKSEALLR